MALLSCLILIALLIFTLTETDWVKHKEKKFGFEGSLFSLTKTSLFEQEMTYFLVVDEVCDRNALTRYKDKLRDKPEEWCYNFVLLSRIGAFLYSCELLTFFMVFLLTKNTWYSQLFPTFRGIIYFLLACTFHIGGSLLWIIITVPFRSANCLQTISLRDSSYCVNFGSAWLMLTCTTLCITAALVLTGLFLRLCNCKQPTHEHND